jgi:LCP family protein required for cell wall assembly
LLDLKRPMIAALTLGVALLTFVAACSNEAAPVVVATAAPTVPARAAATNDPAARPMATAVAVDAASPVAAIAGASPTPIPEADPPTGIPLPTTAPTATPLPIPTPIPTPTPETEEGFLNWLKRSAREAFLALVPDWPTAGRINILLLGIDKQDQLQGNTDVIMLASIDPASESMMLISLPRHLCVGACETWADRINTVAYNRSFDALKAEVSVLMGIPVDFYAAVNFNGFADAIDLVGGIDLWVEREFDELFEFLETREQIRLKLDPGWNQLSGREALLFVRSRKFDSGGDFARICRQQQVIRQLRSKAISLDIIPRLPQLILGLGGWFQTDFPITNVPSFAEVAVGIPRSRIHSYLINQEEGLVEAIVGTDGSQLFKPDRAAIQEYIDTALLESVSDKEGGTSIYCPMPPGEQ